MSSGFAAGEHRMMLGEYNFIERVYMLKTSMEISMSLIIIPILTATDMEKCTDLGT